MIYFMQYRNSKPKRIEKDHALDFYQMWFGNEDGAMKFGIGIRSYMPHIGREYLLFGEEMTESGWFKQILKGKIEDGYVSFKDINAVSECWTSTV